MPNIAIVSMNNGEVTPHIDARSDVEKYASSCRILENMLPLVYGDVTRRPGTQYIASAKLAINPVRLIDFVYSADVAYICEFGNGYVRFFYGGEPLTNNGVVVEIESPYASADLAEIQYKQVGDTMWLVHTNYPPYKLTRTTATTFALSAITFKNGPFRTRNDIELNNGVTLACSVIVVGESGTVTATHPIFQPNHVGALLQFTQNRTTLKVSKAVTGESDAIDVGGTFHFVTHGTWTGTVYLQRSTDNGTNWDNYRTVVSSADNNIDMSATENEENVQYRVSQTISSGTCTSDIILDSSVQIGVVRIDAFTSATSVTASVLSKLSATTATTRWAIGAWQGVRGYPSCVAFFQNRILYAATVKDRQTIWFSATDDYENFRSGLNDADSFSATIACTNSIRWLDSMGDVVVGTSGDEWYIASNKIDQPLSPTNFVARQQTTCGSAQIGPVRSGSAVLFVDPVGRKVREMTFSSERQQYVAPDLTAMAEHISKPRIVAMAMQRNPDQILWCVREDGVLLSMTYERDQNVVAWASHPMDDALVESVAVIPGTDEDEIWLCTVRTIGGATVRYIERMAARVQTDIEEAFYVDCGVQIEGSALTTLTGLSHLEGCTVSILGDGAVYPPQVVASGQVTISGPGVSTASVGLPFQYVVQPMRIDLKTQGGDSHGSFAKISEIKISFMDTSCAQYGTDIDNLFDIPFRSDEPYGSPPELFTGDKTVVLDGGFDPETPFLIAGTDPLPATIRCLVVRWTPTGR